MPLRFDAVDSAGAWATAAGAGAGDGDGDGDLGFVLDCRGAFSCLSTGASCSSCSDESCVSSWVVVV